ncbi:MAG TPA: hypothetical protein VMU50_04280 [Polyangia bacterium]|nr:hypothetical protein [Polyangia bacterium]
MFGKSILLASALTLFVAACDNGETDNTVDQTDQALHKAMCDAAHAGKAHPNVCDPQDTKKTTVCHIPPGNPANAHTICVGNPAVPAHLAHGDHLGECVAMCADAGAEPPPPTMTPPPPPPMTPPPPPPMTPPPPPADAGNPPVVP